ncbi:S-adenosyl-L-methionine-dependent methyltransferase [Hypoxylon sp. FL1150]|nr:S-adenosyl-L-methionine-dependent methyltransferase [Hypoxylon sp. FL1150]
MKAGATVLYATEKLGQRVSEYSESVSLTIPKPLKDYHARIVEESPNQSNYMISSFQSQALVWLARLIGAKRVLEIGVYIGYSSMVWAHAIGPDGKVTGLEYSEEYATAAQKAWKEHGYNNIEVHVGDARETLDKLANPAEPYDIVFIDADKPGYPTYLKKVLELSAPGAEKRLLRPGAVIASDNALRMGFVADDSSDNPNKAISVGPWQPDAIKALREHNAIAAASDRLETFMCPLWDGILLSRLLD